MITVGELDTPVTLQAPNDGSNSNYGGIHKRTWEEAKDGITSVWAHLIWKGGGEKDEADQQTGISKVEFYIRYETYKDALQPTWRIRHQLASASYNYYYIEKVDHIDGRHKMTKLTAVQKDNFE